MLTANWLLHTQYAPKLFTREQVLLLPYTNCPEQADESEHWNRRARNRTLNWSSQLFNQWLSPIRWVAFAMLQFLSGMGWETLCYIFNSVARLNLDPSAFSRKRISKKGTALARYDEFAQQHTRKSTLHFNCICRSCCKRTCLDQHAIK